MSEQVPVEMRLRYIADQRELVHLIGWDTICGTAAEAMNEIVRLRAECDEWEARARFATEQVQMIAAPSTAMPPRVTYTLGSNDE